MKKLVAGLTLVAIVSAYGTATPSSLTSLATNPLITQLIANLGLNPTQAVGAAGALLGLSQHNLAKADWSKIAGVVPGASSLISQAKALGGIKKFSNLAALSGAFTKMGVTSEQVAQVTPAVAGFIGKAAGMDVANKFTAAIK